MTTVNIEYDDDLHGVLEKIDELLEEHKLITVLDPDNHDGFEIVSIEALK